MQLTCTAPTLQRKLDNADRSGIYIPWKKSRSCTYVKIDSLSEVYCWRVEEGCHAGFKCDPSNTLHRSVQKHTRGHRFGLDDSTQPLFTFTATAARSAVAPLQHVFYRSVRKHKDHFSNLLITKRFLYSRTEWYKKRKKKTHARCLLEHSLEMQPKKSATPARLNRLRYR